jgi:hypothetical protein
MTRTHQEDLERAAQRARAAAPSRRARPRLIARVANLTIPRHHVSPALKFAAPVPAGKGVSRKAPLAHSRDPARPPRRCTSCD